MKNQRVLYTNIKLNLFKQKYIRQYPGAYQAMLTGTNELQQKSCNKCTILKNARNERSCNILNTVTLVLQIRQIVTTPVEVVDWPLVCAGFGASDPRGRCPGIFTVVRSRLTSLPLTLSM